MDIVVIFNGLGNQMSQYAFYLARQKNGVKSHLLVDSEILSQHNGFELDRVFHVPYKHTLIKSLLGKGYRKIQFGTRLGRILEACGFNVVREPLDYTFDAQFLEERSGTVNYYKGGWHSEKYFVDCRADILKAFRFDTTLMNAETKKMADEIRRTRVSISLHVRRGDYLQKPWGIYDFSHVATDEYYDKAIDFVKKQVGGEPVFYVFSNDMGWCREHFAQGEFVFVEHNQGLDSWQDMYLMSQCLWHINANSSFSWWGAWLSAHPENTVVPQRFLRNVDTPDVYPQSWIRI